MKGFILAFSLILISLYSVSSQPQPQKVVFEELKPIDVFNLTKFDYNRSEYIHPFYKEEHKIFIGLKLKYTTAACNLLIKNSLTKGNKEVLSALRDTKHPKDKTFDKIYAMMLAHCVENIEERKAINVFKVFLKF